MGQNLVRKRHITCPGGGAVAPTAAARHRWFGAFSAVVALLAACCAASMILASSWQPKPEDLLNGLGLIAAFALARLIAIEFDIRKDTLKITAVEIPLIIGMLAFPSPVVLFSYGIVVLGARLLRRDEWAKLVFNVSYAVLVVAITGLVAQQAYANFPEAPPWSRVLAGFAIGHAIASVLLMLAFWLLGSRQLSDAARPMRQSYVTGVLSAVMGAVAFEVVSAAMWGWLLVGLLSVALFGIYRTYYGLLGEQRDLGLLSRVSLVVAGAGRDTDLGVDTGGDPDEDVWRPAAQLIREQLNATRVVLHRETYADGGVRTVVVGEPLPSTAPRDDPAIMSAGVLTAGPDGVVRHFLANDRSTEVRRELERRGAREALVVALHGAHQPLGILEVHDRQSRLRGFSAADLRVVRTLASHLATAIDNRRLLARLRHDAYHDPLTGLRNRLGFRQAAAERLSRHERGAVVVFDLGVLASVNNALGHGWGDRTVLAAATRLRKCVGDGVLTARLEHDAFAVLLVDVEVAEATTVSQQLRDALSQPYLMDRLALECTAAAGIAMTTIEPTIDVSVLLQRADVALHAARTSDPKVRTYLPTMGQVLLRRFQLVTQFRGALDAGQVALHYQPKVDLASKELVGVEALVRWEHPEFGGLDPAEFVSVVETTGLVEALTGFVLDRALDRCRRWLDEGLRLGVAVNLSVRNLDDPAFPGQVSEALAEHKVSADLLTFELTESAVMRDAERALPVLRRLHELGVGLAVDDFGTGYSSLAYLRRLPVDQVKIDKSFVLGMGTDLSDMAVVRAIVDLGHTLELTVVAEGVEEESVRDQLAGMGCDVAQGFLFCRPLGEQRFDAWLHTRTVRMPSLSPDEATPALLL
jgi:diguanylate cyclase (GGDEF)-like protein